MKSCVNNSPYPNHPRRGGEDGMVAFGSQWRGGKMTGRRLFPVARAVTVFALPIG